MGLSGIYKIVFILLLATLFLTMGAWANDPTDDSLIVPNSMTMGMAASNTSSTGQTALAVRSLSSPAISLSQNSSSNISGIEWQDLLGGNWGETLSSVKQTPDGGYIGCGAVGSPAGDGDVTAYHNAVDAWVIKLNSTGAIQWQRSLGGNNYDQAFSINPTQDGGYILAGLTNSSNSGNVSRGQGGYDAWIVKLNSTGAIEWQNVLGGSYDDVAWSIRQTTPDEGYIFSGITNATMSKGTGSIDLASHPFMGGHAWVVKLDPTGNVTWQKIFGGNGDDIANSIEQTSEGGYIFAATTSSNNSGDVGTNSGLTDIWVVKLYPSGDIQWKKLFGGTGWDLTSPWYDDGIQQTSEGGYIVIGTTTLKSGGTSENEPYHGAGDLWVIKLDSTGNITWQNPYGGSSTEYGQSIRQTPDNGYIFTGITYSNKSGDVSQSFGNGDYWVGKLDSSGALQWQQPLGGFGSDQPETIQPTADGGYIVSGRVYSSNSGVVAEKNHGDTDAWVVKLTPRFVINVRDSDTGDPISGANVGLYDYQNSTWMNQTTQGGPVAFNGSVGSNPFVFNDGSVFGLSVTADGYPTVKKNVTFLVTQQTINVNLTANTRPIISKSYAIADVLSDIDKGQTYIESELKDASWGQPVFEKKDAQVTAAQFGVNPTSSDQTVNDATLLWYFGHGGTAKGTDANGNPLFGNGHTFLDLDQSGVNVYESNITNKWGGKNKWVILQACYILNDSDWEYALGTSHGILGYLTPTNMGGDINRELPEKFLTYAKNGNTLHDSWYKATRNIYQNQKVGQYYILNSKGDYELDNHNYTTDIVAGTIFRTAQQKDTDHLPGIGQTIAPDSSNSNLFVRDAWDCANGNYVTVTP